MVSKIITPIVNKLIGKYLENVDTDQLNISYMKGHFQLEDLSLKPSLFESEGFPIKLAYGHIGRVHVDIPMLSLGSKSTKVDLSDIYLLIL